MMTALEMTQVLKGFEIMKIKAHFKILPDNGIGRITSDDGDDYHDKSQDISGILIHADLNQSPPDILLSIQRHSEYTGGCFGMRIFAPECYGEYKKIRDTFLAKDIGNQVYANNFKIEINSSNQTLTKDNAIKLTQYFLDSIFESFELSQSDKVNLINYCKDGGFSYRFFGDVESASFSQTVFSLFSGLLFGSKLPSQSSKLDERSDMQDSLTP